MTKERFETLKTLEKGAVDDVISITEFLKDPKRSYRELLDITNILTGMISDLSEHYGHMVDKLEPLDDPEED